MRMDEKECYLDKLFFLGMYVGIFSHLFQTGWVGRQRGDTSFAGCGGDVFFDMLHIP